MDAVVVAAVIDSPRAMSINIIIIGIIIGMRRRRRTLHVRGGAHWRQQQPHQLLGQHHQIAHAVEGGGRREGDTNDAADAVCGLLFLRA